MRVLLIEADLHLGLTLYKALLAQRYTVDWLKSGQEAMFALTQTQEHFDLIITELDLPKTDGLSLIKATREKQIITPIMVVSQRDTQDDMVNALDTGADDYIVKPSHPEIIRSRIQALLRRCHKRVANPSITIDTVSIQPTSHQVHIDQKSVPFSRKEFKLLHRLMSEHGNVVSREKLTQLLYGWGDDVDSNTIEVHMHNIRKKLNRALQIKTIRGVGYIIEKQ